MEQRLNQEESRAVIGALQQFVNGRCSLTEAGQMLLARAADDLVYATGGSAAAATPTKVDEHGESPEAGAEFSIADLCRDLGHKVEDARGVGRQVSGVLRQNGFRPTQGFARRPNGTSGPVKMWPGAARSAAKSAIHDYFAKG